MRQAELIYEALGGIDERWPADAHRRPKRHFAAKAALLAACLLLMILVPTIGDILAPKGGVGWWQDSKLPLDIFEYNGTYYEVVPTTDSRTLGDFALPQQITPDMVGQALGWPNATHGTQEETQLYLYQPYEHIRTDTGGELRAQRAVMIAERGGVYSYALFCNFIPFDSNTHQEMSEMLAVYGIDEAADIAEVRIGSRGYTEAADIAYIYEVLQDSLSMGNDSFQQLIFGPLDTEEARQTFSIELAESALEMELITTEGVVARNISYYPHIGYISWALNYYQLDKQL
ncbi:MAG: hypothetical protein IJO80_03110 [Firmicutes bacterium]|nr:hypothetical protein [Bacillota bacterium]